MRCLTVDCTPVSLMLSKIAAKQGVPLSKRVCQLRKNRHHLITNPHRSSLRSAPPRNSSGEKLVDFDSGYYAEPTPGSESTPTLNIR